MSDDDAADAAYLESIANRSFREAFQHWAAKGLKADEPAKANLEPLLEIAYVNGALQTIARLCVVLQREGEEPMLDDMMAILREIAGYYGDIGTRLR